MVQFDNLKWKRKLNQLESESNSPKGGHDSNNQFAVNYFLKMQYWII